MSSVDYILDSNVFIEAWGKYYSPDFCTGYFPSLEQLGRDGILAIPEMVHREIEKKSDELYGWIQGSDIPVLPITEEVQKALRNLYQKDSKHQRLADTSKGRSLADQWVIAHAMTEEAVVVSKEEKIVTPGSTKVKIPNVCDAMDVRCIQDYEFIAEVDIRFEAGLQ